MEVTERQLCFLFITFCAITYCIAQEQKDIMIVSDFSPPAIYVATLGKALNFKQVNVDGGRRNITAPAVVAYDPQEMRIYWTQWSSKWTGEGLIARCDLQGRFYQVLVKDLEYATRRPNVGAWNLRLVDADAVGLALDIAGRKMYFSHEGMALEVANLDGRNRRTVIRELPTSGLFVFFDAIGKRIYVTDSTKKIIESVKLNGSNRTTHLSAENELEHPSGVIVDRKARKIFYIDFGTDRIASSNLRGQQHQMLYQYPLVQADSEPYAIATTLENEMYWIDRGFPRLQKIPKNVKIGQVVTPKVVGNKEFGWPSGLHIYQVGGSDHLRSSSLVLYLVVPMVFQFVLNH